MKKNSPERDISIPELDNFYKTTSNDVFKVVSIDSEKGEAKILWLKDDSYQVWDYQLYPECLHRKLTPLELELL